MENPTVTDRQRLVEPTTPPAADLVKPKESQSQEKEEKAAPKAAGGLSDALLKIPAIQGLIAGAPPAVSAPITEFSKRAEAKEILQHKDALEKAGMAFYKSLSGDVGVLYNRLYVHDDAIKQADQAGQLSQLAPPFDVVDKALRSAGLNHPIFKAAIPAGAAAPPPATPPQSQQVPMPAAPAAAPAPLSGNAQRNLIAARVRNMQPGSPTSGPTPGAGNILRNILKPVV